VREAEARLLAKQTTKVYKPIDGDPAYLGPVRDLVFGADHPAVAAGRIALLHTPGGTGALRVAADLVHALRPGASAWLSTPTWPNHPQVFEAAGLPIRTYPYLGADGELDLDAMLGVLRAVPAGDLVVLHASCHNPTGIDPRPAQWQAIASAITESGALALLDFAYQGFADGLQEDARGVLSLVEQGHTMLVASSFSKNFALYDERVGALSIVGADASETAALLTHAKGVVRANYQPAGARWRIVPPSLMMRSVPMGHGGRPHARPHHTNRRRFVAGLQRPCGMRPPARRGMFSLLAWAGRSWLRESSPSSWAEAA
jgi:aspartate/tyrosine/aromatic aminotransferase